MACHSSNNNGTMVKVIIALRVIAISPLQLLLQLSLSDLKFTPTRLWFVSSRTHNAKSEPPPAMVVAIRRQQL